MEGGMGKQQVESLGSHGNPVGSSRPQWCDRVNGPSVFAEHMHDASRLHRLDV